MSDISQQIEVIEKEIRETPYHKATEHHIGKLRARLAKLKDRDLDVQIRRRQGSGGSTGFALRKQGDATVVLVGPPSSGKSTLLNKLTNAQSKVAPYAFTTVSVIPGMMIFKDAYIQILDVPGLVEGAQKGKGRGKEVLSVVRGADLVLIMSDIGRESLIKNMVSELEGAGIRLNGTAPNLKIEKKSQGGLILHTNIKQELGEYTIKEILSEFGIKNAEVTLKEKLTLERLIDGLSLSRVYVPAIFILNKEDMASATKKISLNCLYISAEKSLGLDKLKEEIWRILAFVRVYLVKQDETPSYVSPIVMKKGQKLKDVLNKLGSDFEQNKKLAKIWGGGAKFPGQEVSLDTKIEDGMQIRFS